MIETVTERRLITEYESAFRANLRATFRIKSIRDVWTPEGTDPDSTVFVSKELGMWACLSRHEDRFWNAFGLLSDSKRVSPNLEVNFPLQGIDRSVSGVFLTDRNEVAVGYRGHIGGGKKGVGKSLFMRKYPEPLVPIQDGDRQTRVALVEGLDNDDLARRLSWLMKQVIQMKKSAKSGKGYVPQKSITHTPEFEGPRKPYSIFSEIRAEVIHGKIVNQLTSQAKALGYDLYRDQSRDLYRIDRSKRMIATFEIKPDCSPYDIYTAIGQLKYHTVESGAKQFAVLPDLTSKETLLKLRRLSIESITFTMRGKAVKFHHLATKLRALTG